MKAIIKIIGTILSISAIIIGLTALFTIDNAQSITELILYAALMILGIAGGVYLLTLMYPELADVSEFEEGRSILNDYEQELADLREHNMLLIDRYISFKSILKSSNVINDSNKDKFPNLYRLLYEEDLVCGVNTIKEGSLEQIDKVK